MSARSHFRTRNSRLWQSRRCRPLRPRSGTITTRDRLARLLPAFQMPQSRLRPARKMARRKTPPALRTTLPSAGTKKTSIENRNPLDASASKIAKDPRENGPVSIFVSRKTKSCMCGSALLRCSRPLSRSRTLKLRLAPMSLQWSMKRTATAFCAGQPSACRAGSPYCVPAKSAAKIAHRGPAKVRGRDHDGTAAGPDAARCWTGSRFPRKQMHGLRGYCRAGRRWSFRITALARRPAREPILLS